MRSQTGVPAQFPSSFGSEAFINSKEILTELVKILRIIKCCCQTEALHLQKLLRNLGEVTWPLPFLFILDLKLCSLSF